VPRIRESDSMPARASPSGFAAPYTGGFAFRCRNVFSCCIYTTCSI